MNDILIISLTSIGIAFLLLFIWIFLKTRNLDKFADKVDYIIETILRNFP